MTKPASKPKKQIAKPGELTVAKDEFQVYKDKTMQEYHDTISAYNKITDNIVSHEQQIKFIHQQKEQIIRRGLHVEGQLASLEKNLKLLGTPVDRKAISDMMRLQNKDDNKTKKKEK